MHNCKTSHNRSTITLLNALSAIGLTFVNGILGIVVTRMVIGQYGSDFNGLNSTANQIVNVLLVIEGGFTLASNVALFSPLTNKDYRTVNRILSVTRRKFKQIGILFLCAGLAISAAYTIVVNSHLPPELIFTVMLMTVIPSAFNLYYATTYRVLLQTEQREYVINFITMFTIGLGHVANIVLILLDGSVWMVRFLTMLAALLNSLMIAGYVRKTSRFISLDDGRNEEVIRGTRDVLIQRITGMVYNSAPIVFLSISPSGGTVLASVYAVYNNVFNMLKSLLRSVIDAPRLGIGQMLTEEKKERVWEVFVQYEYVAFLSIFVAVTTAFVLILPFISIYMEGVADADYYDARIAVLMTLIAVFEMIHIPSGHLINMAGEFKVSRNIQAFSCAVLIVSMGAGGLLRGVYGLLEAVLLVAVLLAVLEMGYVHAKYFPGHIKDLFRLILPLAAAGAAACFFEKQIFGQIGGILDFIIAGMILTAVNTVLAVLAAGVSAKKELTAIVHRGMGLMKKFKAI